MHENDSKDLLKEILRRASLTAQQQRLSIDFNASFALVAHPDWKIVIFDNRSTTIDCAELKYVYDASGNFIVIPDYDARLARMPSKVLYMDKLDEYDYLIPLDVYRIIIEKLCVSGAYVKVKHPRYDEVSAQFNHAKESVWRKIHEYIAKHPELDNKQILLTPFYVNLIAQHKAKWQPLMQSVKDVRFDIVPAYVTSIEALHVWLDLDVV